MEWGQSWRNADNMCSYGDIIGVPADRPVVELLKENMVEGTLLEQWLHPMSRKCEPEKLKEKEI